MAENSKIEQLKNLLNECDWLPWHGSWMKTPFRSDKWLCVTNGHFMVAVEDSTDAPNPPGHNPVHVRSILSHEVSGESFDLEHLKKWSHRETPVCNICHGSGEDKCDDCGGKGKFKNHRPCGTCCGTGKVECICHYAVPATLFGKTVNLLLVHRAIKLFTGEFQVGGPAEPKTILVIGGKGWKACIMPMRSETKEAYEPVVLAAGERRA